jgi:protocatechuate 3,4-dioxygenase alpha subunit
MPVSYLKETPSQTGGPYVHIGTMPSWAGLNLRTQEKPWVMTTAESEGERIRIEGTVYDGSGAPVKDALIEIWQADGLGRYNAPGFPGWGRTAAVFETGVWHFETVKPGRTPWRDGRPQAPHVSLLIFARGINIHLHTRMYFDDEAEANAADPVLRSIEQRHLVNTLIGRRENQGAEAVYRFDIHLQGDKETVFFDM